jgi:retron-type reverse transcriptase
LVKLVLEPQWEARFEPNSYGFRPGCTFRENLGHKRHNSHGGINNRLRGVE